MKALSEPNVTTYHYEYDANGNRTTVEIKDDGLTLESTVYTYDRLNKLVSSREVTASGLYLYEYTYDDNGNLIKEDRHRQYELNTNQWTNIRRYEYTKDNKLESVYSGNTLLVSYTYDGDGTITSSLERDLDLNQNLNIHDTNYINSLTNNQRQLINKVSSNDSFLYELTEYITDKNRPYSETLMERDGTGHLSTIYTYGNQRISNESYNNLSGLYTYDGRGSVSAVIGGYGDFRASYWYDGLGNVKSSIHGYGAFGSGKKYYGYNAEQYNPVTGNQNLRARQLNIRRQRFLTEDTYLGKKNSPLTLNRYICGNGNPLKYKDPNGHRSIPMDVQQDIFSIYSNEIGKHFTTLGNMVGIFVDDLFDFEFKTGVSFGGSVSLGPVKIEGSLGGYDTVINGRFESYNEESGPHLMVSALSNKYLSIGVEEKDGEINVIYPGFSGNNVDKKFELGDDFKFSVGIDVPDVLTMSGQHLGFEASINLSRIVDFFINDNYIDNLQRRAQGLEPLTDDNIMNMSYIKTLQQQAIEMGVKPKCQ